MIAEPLRSLAVPIGELSPLPGNPRRGDVAAVKRSLERFGQRKPVVARADGTVIAGNHMLAAARELGWPALAVTRVDDDDATAKAFALADNRTAELGSFDLGDLAAMAAEVQAVDPGLLLAASYSDEDLNALLAGVEVPAKLTDPDAVPEPPAVPVSRPGDLWLLGPHRLLCGDATKAEDHERVLDGAAVDLVLTDPPYGVNIDYGIDYEDTPEELDRLLAGFLPLARQWPVVLATTGVRHLWRYPAPDWTLAWVVPAGNGAGPWGYTTWTPVVAYGRDPYLARGLGSRPDSISMMATRDPGHQGHPVIKPVEVWKWLMERGSPEPNQVVLDPLAGSGTGIIAAHQLNRRCMAIELSPQYVDTAARRWQEHAGEKPILEATGEPHDFTA